MTAISQNPNVFDNNESTTINQDTFATNETPVTKVQKKTINQGANLIKRFLKQDFQAQGYETGYLQPKKIVLDNKLLSIKAEFQQILEQLIEITHYNQLKYRKHLIDVKGIDEIVEQKLELHIQHSTNRITEFKEQKALSEQSQGIIRSALLEYKQGFRRGVSDYQEEKLFAGSTGLFFQ